MIAQSQRTIVHLLRHGEVHNPQRVLYGRLPGYGLSAVGADMALAAAEWLKGRDVVSLVSSPLDRARQTAEPLAAMFGLDVRIDDRLIESENLFQGRSVDGGVRAFLAPSDWRLIRNPLRPSWGEPYEHVAERMLAAVTDVREEVAGHEAVLVSHQLPIYILRRHVEGRRLWHRPDRRLCGLASITTFEYAGDRLAGVRYSEPAGEAAREDVPPGA